jgi:hypothetical protein
MQRPWASQRYKLLGELYVEGILGVEVTEGAYLSVSRQHLDLPQEEGSASVPDNNWEDVYLEWRSFQTSWIFCAVVVSTLVVVFHIHNVPKIQFEKLKLVDWLADVCCRREYSRGSLIRDQSLFSNMARRHCKGLKEWIFDFVGPLNQI